MGLILFLVLYQQQAAGLAAQEVVRLVLTEAAVVVLAVVAVRLQRVLLVLLDKACQGKETLVAHRIILFSLMAAVVAVLALLA